MRFILPIAATILMAVMMSCGNSASGGSDKFPGHYTDEFGNKFVLNDDYTATIQFDGVDKVIETNWYDGPDHNSAYATIEYNGNPFYYFMRDGNLYRHREDMEKGRPAIKLTRTE